MQHSASARTASAGLYMLAGKLFTKLIDFGTLLVLSRMLQPLDFGLVAMGMTLVLIVDTVLELPVTQALLRLQDAPEGAYDTAFTLSLIRGGVIAGLVALLAYPLSWFYDEPRLVSLVAALALGPAVKGLISPRMAAYQRQLDFRFNALIELFGKIGAFLAASAVAYSTGSYWALAVANITTPLLTAVASYMIAPYRPRLRLTEWSEFADMVGWHSLSQLAVSLNWQMDKFLLGRFTEPVSLGRFFMAENVAAIPNSSIIGPITYPLVAAFSSLRSKEALATAYARASNAIIMIGAPPLLVLAWLADPLVRTVFDPKWASAAPILQLLALANLIPMPIEPMAGLAMSLNRTRLVTWRSFLDLAVRLPATLIGVAYFGMVGAIAARGFANLVHVGLGMTLVTRLSGMTVMEQLRNLLRPASAVAAMSAALLSIEPFLKRMPAGPTLAVATIATALLGCGVFAATILITWNWAGRPPGAEALAMGRIEGLRASLRQRW